MAIPSTPPFSGPGTPSTEGEGALDPRGRHSKRPRLNPDSPSHPIYCTSSDEEASTSVQAIRALDSSDEGFEYTIDDGDDGDDDDGAVGFSDDGGDVDDTNDLRPVLSIAALEEDMAYAECMLEGTGITLQLTLYDLVITVPLLDLPPNQRAACGLTTLDPIRVTLQLTNGYRRSSPKPIVLVRYGDLQEGGHGIETSSIRANAGFPVGLKITQTALSFFNERWEANRGEDFLSDLALRLNDRLINAGNTCMMCDEELPFPGVKPTVCDRDLCAYQLDNLGLGADLSLFDTDYMVADLLITAAVTACNDTHRQSVSPVATPINRSNGSEAHYTVLELGRLLNCLPSAEVIRDVGPLRESFLKESDPYAPFVVGWVFATNRAHIVSLEQEKHVKNMNTSHQFQIHTSTRKHAEKFEALRAQHGSFFAFHGSSMSNWHNILRQNLKNASRTPMMSAGAAYGEGIYLASSSSTSSSYARATLGWANSALGASPMCLALVEVANSSRVHHHLQGQIIVASDENCVMLRQLFVYPQGGIPVVKAQDIAQARFKNQTTIAYGSTFEEVQESGKLLITSDDYFWDIDEVVEMVKAKNGLFINSCNQLPFAQQDVDKIMSHACRRRPRSRARTRN